MYIQSKFPSALCGIHNFIHIHVPQVEVNEAENYDLHGNAGDHIVHGVGYVVVDDIKEGDVAAQWNTIAQVMWDDYLVAQERAGYNVNTFFDNK